MNTIANAPTCNLAAHPRCQRDGTDDMKAPSSRCRRAYGVIGDSRIVAHACGLFAAALSLITPAIAHADASCQQLVADQAATLGRIPTWLSIDMTMHRDTLDLVTYSQGRLVESFDGWLRGYANQLFSDRMNANQPFDVDASDDIEIFISPSGELILHYQTWDFWTSWDMSCQGNLMTQYIPGHGVVTLGVRSLQYDEPLLFSSGGPVAGQQCTQINEPSDPDTWNDNYLCSQNDEGFQWSFAGPIGGMRCTQIAEPSDPHTWSDNYLCVPGYSPYQFVWSSAGPVPDKVCTRWLEVADPNTWDDNYLCY